MKAYELFVKYDQHEPYVNRSWVSLQNPPDVLSHLSLYDENPDPHIPEIVIMVERDIIRKMGDGGVSMFTEDMKLFKMDGVPSSVRVETQWPFLAMWDNSPTLTIISEVH